MPAASTFRCRILACSIVLLPAAVTAPLRLVIEEIELHREGIEYDFNNPFLPGQSERVVFTDTVELEEGGEMPGMPEMLIVLAIVLLLFGSTQGPKLARSLGRARREFSDASKDVD